MKRIKRCSILKLNKELFQKFYKFFELKSQKAWKKNQNFLKLNKTLNLIFGLSIEIKNKTKFIYILKLFNFFL